MQVLIHVVFGEHELVEQPLVRTTRVMFKFTYDFAVHDNSYIGQCGHFGLVPISKDGVDITSRT